MWSPKTNKDGGFNRFYENMKEIDVGDIVFCFADALIKTVGVVSSSDRSAEKPKEFGKADASSHLSDSTLRDYSLLRCL